MNKMTQEDNSLHTERVLPLPSPVKRPRTHSIVTNEHSGESKFDFPDLLTFENTTKFPCSKSILQKNLIVICTTDNDDMQEESFLQLQDIKLIVTPRVATSIADDADMLLPKVCVITAERHLVHPGKDLLTKSDKPFSYLPNEAGNALVESYISTDMSSPSDAFCHWLGKPQALDFTQDWRQAQLSVTKMQAFTLTCDEEIMCQSDCSRGNVVYDTVNTWSQSNGAEASTQKWDEHIFSESSLISKEGQVGNGSRSCSNYADFELNHSYSKKDHTNEEKLLQSQIFKSDRFTICDEETKGQVNEMAMGENPFLSAADISVFPHDVVLGRNTTTENVRFEIDDLCGVKGEYAAGKMNAWNEMDDHTTEAPESQRISQEPAEEDNNVGLYSVIDPAIWNEPDKEAEERQCNSASTAGVELSPSVKVCEMKMPPPLCFDVRTSQEVSAPNQIRQFYHQSITLQCKDEKEDLCQSYKEPKAASITSSEPYNMTGNQSSSPCCPPAGDGRQESHSAVELQLKEQDQFDSFPNSLDNIRTQEAEQSQAEVSRTAWITMIKERNDLASFEEIKTDPHMNLEKVVESEEELLHRNELQKEDGACNELKCVKHKLEEKFELFVDHPYSAHVFKIVETTVEKKRKKGKDVEEGLKVAECENAEDVQQQNEHKTDRMEVAHVKCVGKQTDSNRSDNRLTLVNQHREENKLSFCPDYRHRLETYMLENTHDLVAFASPPTSDAVVPCHKEPRPSLNANSPTALNRSGRFSPVASACIRYNWVPGEVDIFEKIQLSPDDYSDNDAGLGNMSVLTGFPERLSKSPQRQPSYSTQEPESNHQAPEEQGREEEELQQDRHTEYMASGLLNSDASFNGPNFISAALGRPEQQPNCESTCDSFELIMVDSDTQSKSSTGSTDSDGPASDVKEYPGFEMKKQFNMVLKELKLFFDISKSDRGSDRKSWPKQCHDISEPLKTDSSDFKDPLSSTDTGCHKNSSTDNADEDHSMEMCGGDPVISCKAGDDEQEVPLGSHMKHETCQDTAEKQGELWQVEQRRKMWSPPFMSQQLSHSLLEQAKRLGPLRTCSRPIRVGLSKRAKTKHLHRPHPYE